MISTSGMWPGRYKTSVTIWILLVAILLVPVMYKRLLAELLPGMFGFWLGIALRILVAWFAWDTLTRGLIRYPLNVPVQLPLLVVVLIRLLGGVFWDVRNQTNKSREGKGV